MVDSNIPNWLADRVNYAGRNTSSVAQDIQIGQQVAQQRQESGIRARAAALREEAMRLKISATEFITKGSLELGRLMEEGGEKGIYATDEFEGRLYGLGQRFPQLIDSDAFRGAAKVVENAKLASNKAATTEYIQTEISRRNAENIDSRFRLMDQRLDAELQKANITAEQKANLERLRSELRAENDAMKAQFTSALEDQKQGNRERLQDQRDDAALNRQRVALDNALKVVDAKSEHAKELRELQSKLDRERDAAKPTTLRPDRYDLDESDRTEHDSEIRSLERWRRIRTGPQFDAEYDQRMQKIRDKYAPRKKTRSSPSTSAAPQGKATEAPVPPPEASKREVGTVYQTPKGPYKWTGNGWVAP
jgi:hypothetical protein